MSANGPSENANGDLAGRLHEAARAMDEPAVRRLLEGEGSRWVDVLDHDGYTPLLAVLADPCAVMQPRERVYPVLRLLLERGANPDGHAEMVRTPLTWVAQQGRLPYIEFLLNHGADATRPDATGCTPLHAVARAPWLAGRADVAKRLGPQDAGQAADLLVRLGAAVNARDRRGRTPLHEAACRLNVPLVEALIGHGADVNAADRFGRTPLDEAQDHAAEGPMPAFFRSFLQPWPLPRWIKRRMIRWALRAAGGLEDVRPAVQRISEQLESFGAHHGTLRRSGCEAPPDLPVLAADRRHRFTYRIFPYHHRFYLLDATFDDPEAFAFDQDYFATHLEAHGRAVAVGTPLDYNATMDVSLEVRPKAPDEDASLATTQGGVNGTSGAWEHEVCCELDLPSGRLVVAAVGVTDSPLRVTPGRYVVRVYLSGFQRPHGEATRAVNGRHGGLNGHSRPATPQGHASAHGGNGVSHAGSVPGRGSEPRCAVVLWPLAAVPADHAEAVVHAEARVT